jgi:hypothetical protein
MMMMMMIDKVWLLGMHSPHHYQVLQVIQNAAYDELHPLLYHHQQQLAAAATQEESLASE